MCRHTGEGMSKPEVIRCLKRYVAREVYSALRQSARSIISAGQLARAFPLDINSMTVR